MNNLKLLRKQKMLNQDDLGKIVGVTKMTISRWESGKSDIDFQSLKKLSEYFDTSIDYILGIDDKPPEWQKIQQKTEKVPAETHRVPIVGSVACSWDEGFIEEFDGEYAHVNDYLYHKYGDMIRATVARGNSMQEMISPGDLLIVVPATDVENNDVVIATIGDDELTAKKFHYNDSGGFDLIPVNPSYGRQSFSQDEIAKLPVKVVARVVEIRKGLRA